MGVHFGPEYAPDSDLIGLIEQAYLADQINSRKADLTFFWLEANKDQFGPKRYPVATPKENGPRKTRKLLFYLVPARGIEPRTY